MERLGWQWVYDHSANLICPQDPCSVVKCGFHASCTVVGDQGICACDVGYSQGNPYQVILQPKITLHKLIEINFMEL